MFAVCGAPLAASTLVGCDGPASASLVQGEPVCPDFRIGAAGTKMHGGLRQPLQMKVMDGRTTVATVVVVGLQSDGAEPTRFLLPDGNNEYSLEWSQCPNERAPMPVDMDTKHSNGAPKFFCGETKPFKTEKLVTKKGDESTRRVTVPALPNPACWTDETPDPTPSATAAPSAMSTPSAMPTPSGMPSVSATAEPEASATTPSASAAPSSRAAPTSSSSSAPRK